MRSFALFFSFAISFVFLHDANGDVRIGAFNIEDFGQSKIGKSNVVDILALIVDRYDVLLIQEISDIEGTAIDVLLKAINDMSVHKYAYVISDRLGRTNSKEQYAFVYKNDGSVEAVDQYVFDDALGSDGNDIFEREPFIVKFLFQDTAIGTVILGGLHTKPANALEELNALKPVFDDIILRWGTDNIIMMGDFNADCDLLSDNQKLKVELLQNGNYLWPLGHDVDTTVSNTTDCAYDRFIVSGSKLQNTILNGSAAVFNFEEEYDLSHASALEVSDHFPIEITLENKAATSGIKIAAFDVRPFDATKEENTEVLSALAKIIRRYHLVYLQGITTNLFTGLNNLIRAVNRDPKSSYSAWRKSSSAYMYSSKYSRDSRSFSHSQLFQREPQIARFHLESRSIVFVGVQINPSDAEAELNALPKVVSDIQGQYYDTKDIVIMGNMAADCIYLPPKKWSKLEVVKDTSYYWPIDGSADTMVSLSDCATDRFIVHGERINNSIVPGSAGVFNFQQFYGYNATFAQGISNHFPIEMNIDWSLGTNIPVSPSSSGPNGTSNAATLYQKQIFLQLVVAFNVLVFSG